MTRSPRCVVTTGRIAVILVVLVLSAAQTSWAQGPPRPIDTIIRNTPTEPVPVTVVDPVHGFSNAPAQVFLVPAGADVPADPSGTRYAITSLTLSNPATIVATFSIRAIASSASLTSCQFVFNATETAAGPTLVAGPQSTTHITFPQPFVTAPVTGQSVCLAGGGNNTTGTTWSAVGYKILP